MRRFYSAQVGMAGRRMAITRESNYCELDKDMSDKYGIPVLKFYYSWIDAEIKQAKHIQETFQALCTRLKLLSYLKLQAEHKHCR